MAGRRRIAAPGEPQCIDCGGGRSRRSGKRCRVCYIAFHRGPNHPDWTGGRGTCEGCGIALAKYSATYCRSCCRAGERSPNWTGGKSEEAGRQQARRLFPFDDHECETPECTALAVDRHHKDGNTWNNEPRNIEFLCRRCHMAADGRLEVFVGRAR